jgi:glycosyltransferase 2 family protein
MSQFISGRARTVIKKVWPVVFYALVFVFLILYLRDVNFAVLSNVRIDWSYFVLATAMALVTRYWGVYIWLTLLRGLGAENLKANWQLAYVYAKAWMGRYIPGTAPWILGKIYFASQQGISKNKLAVSSMLEGGLQVVTTLAVALVMLLFDSRLDVVSPEIKLAMIAILGGCIVAVFPPVFNRIVMIVYRLVRRKQFPPEHLANGQIISRGAFLYMFGAVLNGLTVFFAAKTLYPELSYNDLLFVMGAGNLAGALGMLAIFVPSGIGVREGVQLVLFSLIMPKEMALLITITTRLWAVAIDFLFVGLSKMLALGTKSAP